jgi:hypothetical protein
MSETESRARLDLILADLEYRQEQIRKTRQDYRQDDKYKAWQVAFAGMTSGAALFAAGAAFVKFLG